MRKFHVTPVSDADKERVGDFPLGSPMGLRGLKLHLEPRWYKRAAELQRRHDSFICNVDLGKVGPVSCQIILV